MPSSDLISNQVHIERTPTPQDISRDRRRTKPPPLRTQQQPLPVTNSQGVRFYRARSSTRWYQFFTGRKEPPSPLRYQVHSSNNNNSNNVFQFSGSSGRNRILNKIAETSSKVSWPQTPTGEQVVQAAASAGKFTLTMTVILCLVGVAYQLFSLTTDFLAYKIVSEVMITKDDFVRPPALSICVPYSEAIDWSKTPEGAQPRSIVGTDEFKRKIQEKYNISDLIKWTPRIDDFLRYSWIRKQGSYGISESDPKTEDLVPDLSVTKFIKDYYICYSFKHVNATKDTFFFRSHHISFGRRPGQIMGLHFHNQSFIPIRSAIIYLHPVDIYPRGDRDYPIILVGNTKDVFDDSSTYWGITYTETTLYLLPSPYGTNCIPYKKTTRWENEIHCQHDCVSREFVAKFGKSLFTATELETDENNFTSYSKFSLTSDEEEEKVDKIIDKCNKSCPGLNCVRKYYIPQVLVKRDVDDVVFELYDMNGPESLSWAHEKMPPLTYLIGVISIIGVWMGISCIDILKNAFTFPSRVTKMKTLYNPNPAVTSCPGCPK